jgi:hypothetical protein
MHHHCACPEHIAMQRDVMVKVWERIPHSLAIRSVSHDVPLPWTALSGVCWDRRILWTFYFIHVVPNIPLISLYQHAREEEVTQNLIKDFDVCVLTSGVGTPDPQVPPQDAKA